MSIWIISTTVIAIGGGLTDISYKGSQIFSQIWKPETPHAMADYTPGIRPRAILDGVQCSRYATRKQLLSYQSQNTSDCAVRCLDHPSCSFFEYYNESNMCYALPSDTPYPELCQQYDYNISGNTYAVVYGVESLRLNNKAIAFYCPCHHSNGDIHIGRGGGALVITSNQVSIWGKGDYSIEMTVDFESQNSSIQNNRIEPAVLFSRGKDVFGLVHPNGAIEFSTSNKDSCLTSPYLTFDKMNSRVGTGFRLLFSRQGSLQIIEIDNSITFKCQSVDSHYTPVGSITASVSTYHMAVFKPLFLTENLPNRIRCADRYLIEQATLLTESIYLDCGALCGSVPGCAFFAHNSFSTECSLYSDCSVHNTTELTYNGTMYEVVEGVQNHPIFSMQTASVCAQVLSDPPINGSALIGASCETGITHPSYRKMFFNTVSDRLVRLTYNPSLCLSVSTIQQGSYITVVWCDEQSVLQWDLSGNNIKPFNDQSLCIEFPTAASTDTSNFYLVLEKCSNDAVNQTASLVSYASRTVLYKWASHSGLAKWTIRSPNPAMELLYSPTDEGIGNYATSTDYLYIQKDVRVSSPSFCNPTEVSFRLGGGTGNDQYSKPGDIGFLGVGLRNVDNDQYVKYHMRNKWNPQVPNPYYKDLVEWSLSMKGCFVLEIIDSTSNGHFAMLQDVSITTGSSEHVVEQQCSPIHKIIIRSASGFLRLSEIHIFDAMTQLDISSLSTVTASSSLNSSSVSFIIDNDYSTFHQTATDSIAEYVQVTLPKKTVISHIQLSVSLSGSYCESQLDCLLDASRIYIQLISESRVVSEYPNLNLAIVGNSNYTLGICGGVVTDSEWGVVERGVGFSNSSEIEYLNLQSCIDGSLNGDVCTVRSEDSKYSEPYFKLDLLQREAVDHIRYYADYNQRMKFISATRTILVHDSSEGPYSFYSDDTENSEELSSVECFNNTVSSNSSIWYFDVPCQLMGRYVYIISSGYEFTLSEIEVFTSPTSLSPNWDSTFLTVEAYNTEPMLTRLFGKGSDWSETACSVEPFKEITIIIDSCTKDVRISLVDADRQKVTSLDELSRYFNTTQYENSTTTVPGSMYTWSLRDNTIYMKGTSIGTSGSVTTDSCDSSATQNSYTITRKGKVITLSHDTTGVNTTLSNAEVALYACVSLYEHQSVKYTISLCDDQDWYCKGIDWFHHDILLGGKLSDSTNTTETRMLLPKSVGDNVVFRDVMINSHTAVKTGNEIKYANTNQDTQLPHGNITNYGTCSDDFTIRFSRLDAGFPSSQLLMEFNTTEQLYIKLLFNQKVSLPWLTHAGWSFVPQSSISTNKYSVYVDGIPTTQQIAVKLFTSHELVQLHGSQFDVLFDSDMFFEPYLICASKTLDVDLETSYLSIFEGFEEDLGDCPNIIEGNPPDSSRTWSSVYSTATDEFIKGRLDSIRCWRALTDTAGEYHQLDIGSNRLISGVITRGNEYVDVSLSQWVTSYKVNYSLDGLSWSEIEDGRIFQGNYDYNTKVQNHFKNLLLARYIRVIAQTWHYNIAMRIGLALCSEGESSFSGFAVNNTGKHCRITTDTHNKVEGESSIAFSGGSCDETIVENIINQPIRVSKLSVWGRTSDAYSSDSWVFQISGNAFTSSTGISHESDISFRTSGLYGFTAGEQVAGGVRNLTWFCLSVFFSRDDGNPNIITAVHWYLSGVNSPPFSTTDPPQGIGSGVIPVMWNNDLTVIRLIKSNLQSTSWFDAVEVWTVSEIEIPLLTFNSPALIKEVDKCSSYLGYNASGDFTEHRLTALDRPLLSYDHCIEKCCSLVWCTGVVVPSLNSTKGCKLIRKRFFNVTLDDPREEPEAISNWDWRFFLKVSVVSATKLRYEIPDYTLNALNFEANGPHFIETGTDEIKKNSRHPPRSVLTYVLFFRGALMDLTTDVIRNSVVSSVSSSSESNGFESLKASILPDSSIDLSSYPPYVVVDFTSVPGYRTSRSETLSWGYMHQSLRDANISNPRHGVVIGAHSIPVIKLRKTHPCDGSLECRNKPCDCASLECQRAYICGCSYSYRQDSLTQSSNTRFKVSDTVIVHNDVEFIRYVESNSGTWLSFMTDYVGQEAVVQSVEDSNGNMVIKFADAVTILFSNKSVAKTAGTEMCKYHRRPGDWPYDTF